MAVGKVRFRERIQIKGINPYVLVNAARAVRLKPDWRRPLPVRIRVNGEPKVPWRTNLMPVGDGSFYLYLHGDVREASRSGVGDVVNVAAEFDREYKGGPAAAMPTWFGRALRRNAVAHRNWKQLSPSRQKEILRYLTSLKSPEAQQRNTRRALHVLAGGKARFMARSWG
ncbi:MAG TPA: YdeI/OmpD-associated family protein [Steroidobacteraceae bacterium]|jgi:hypothetical protein